MDILSNMLYTLSHGFKSAHQERELSNGAFLNNPSPRDIMASNQNRDSLLYASVVHGGLVPVDRAALHYELPLLPCLQGLQREVLHPHDGTLPHRRTVTTGHLFTDIRAQLHEGKATVR